MKIFLPVVFCITAVVALPVDIVEDQDGQLYHLLPLQRQRRETPWKVSDAGAAIGQKGTVFKNDNHQVDASILAGKLWNSPGIKPDQYTGRLDYSHLNSGSGAFLQADRNIGAGTDVAAGLKYNIVQNKNINADLTAQYSRQFGGPFGTGPANYGGFLNVNIPFGG